MFVGHAKNRLKRREELEKGLQKTGIHFTQIQCWHHYRNSFTNEEYFIIKNYLELVLRFKTRASLIGKIESIHCKVLTRTYIKTTKMMMQKKKLFQ